MPSVSRRIHLESHNAARSGWLRAAVLGANDGIVSTASLIAGVASAGADQNAVLLAGAASLIAGAMSMAAGEYVSVSSQADAVRADLARERQELADDVEFEQAELASIYIQRGLDADLARRVADQLMAKDALQAHARDELGITEFAKARPVQAAFASAASFAAGAALPLAASIAAPENFTIVAVVAAALLSLAGLGWLGARAGAAKPMRAIVRVTFWGALAMAITAAAGAAFGVVV
jgi:VIT1/CCC1 family predicted Fe2+/Mn2+ transporter